MKSLATYFICLSILLSGCIRGKDEVFIIPKNYTGYIVIIYDQESGAPAKYVDGKRLYEIPSTGIFKTQFQGNYDWTNLTEFYYENINPSNKIPFYIKPHPIPKDSIVAYGGESGNVNKDLAGKERVAFTLFYIGNNTQIHSAYEQAQKLDIAKLAEEDK